MTETIGPAEFRELPSGFFTVIADDVVENADRAEKAVHDGFSSGNIVHGDIHKAQNPMDLLQSALFGNKGQQADVVLLDDRFDDDLDSWISNENDLLLLAKQSGIDNSIFKKPEHGSRQYSEEMPDNLYLPNSTHFAMLLRIFGYKNNIFVVSSQPPDVNYIESEVKALAKFAPNKYNQIFPINGFSTKSPCLGKMFFANSIFEDRWDSAFIQGDLSQSLQKLFLNQPSRQSF
jgi:hypothetical protein